MIHQVVYHLYQKQIDYEKFYCHDQRNNMQYDQTTDQPHQIRKQDFHDDYMYYGGVWC